MNCGIGNSNLNIDSLDIKEENKYESIKGMA